MTPDQAALLICPLCQASMSLTNKQLICTAQHSFDLAKQGYVNLLPVQHKKSKSPGDSKPMVLARREFLQGGYYAPIAAALCETMVSANSDDKPIIAPVILDAGCGEGYYLDYLLQRLAAEATVTVDGSSATSFGLDISKDAVAEATKRNKSVSWIVGTNARLPVKDHCLDWILCLFGFPCYDEFVKKLNKGGAIVIVDAGPDHLIELRQIIYQEVKKSAGPTHEALLALGGQLSSSIPVNFKISLTDSDQIQNLLAMTPHMYKAPPEGREAVAALSTIELTVDVVVRVFRFF